MSISHFLTPPPLTNGNSLWGAVAVGEICGRNQFCPAHFLHRLRRTDKVTIRRVRKIKPNSRRAAQANTICGKSWDSLNMIFLQKSHSLDMQKRNLKI